MPQLPALSPEDLRSYHAQIRQRYDAFARRGVKLNLTRGKPSAAGSTWCISILRSDLPRVLPEAPVARAQPSPAPPRGEAHSSTIAGDRSEPTLRRRTTQRRRRAGPGRSLDCVVAR